MYFVIGLSARASFLGQFWKPKVSMYGKIEYQTYVFIMGLSAIQSSCKTLLQNKALWRVFFNGLNIFSWGPHKRPDLLDSEAPVAQHGDLAHPSQGHPGAKTTPWISWGFFMGLWVQTSSA